MIFTSEQKKIIFLVSLGAALEFYDFVIFGFSAKLLSQLFFPYYNNLAALLATFGLFAAGYLIRPISGIIFGHFGDKYGRKKIVVGSVFLMAISTLLIGVLPTYNQIGISASLLLIMLRLLQGFSVGGEIPGALVYLIEIAPVKYRGLASGLLFLGINSGLLLGSLLITGLSHSLSQQQLLDWGWRIAFLLGSLLCLISYQLRKQLHETPYFILLTTTETFPLKQVLTAHKWLALKGIFITGIGAATVSLFFLYMPTYLSGLLHLPFADAFMLNSLTIFIFTISVLPISYLSDYVGRKKIMTIGVTFILLGSYPLFLLINTGNYVAIAVADMIAAIFTSMITACFACMLAELYPTAVRYTGLAVSYNMGIAIFSGLTPLIASSLINITHNNLSPAYYLIASAFIVLILLKSLPYTSPYRVTPSV